MADCFEPLPFGKGMKECPVHGQVMTNYMTKPDGSKFWFACPKCCEEREAKEKSAQEKWEEEKLKSDLVKAGVKEKFWSMTFDDYKPQNESQEKALSLVKAIAEGSSKRSLILIGPNGTGKTMLATLALMSIIKKGKKGFIRKMYEIIIRIKASYKANAKEDEQDILSELSKVPLLIIDEVGRQFGSESERNWLSYVIDERYEDLESESPTPTILISNLKLMRDCSDKEKELGSYLERYLGADSVSRLAECADIVSLEGKDFRRNVLTQ